MKKKTGMETWKPTETILLKLNINYILFLRSNLFLSFRTPYKLNFYILDILTPSICTFIYHLRTITKNSSQLKLTFSSVCLFFNVVFWFHNGSETFDLLYLIPFASSLYSLLSISVYFYPRSHIFGISC